MLTTQSISHPASRHPVDRKANPFLRRSRDIDGWLGKTLGHVFVSVVASKSVETVAPASRDLILSLRLRSRLSQCHPCGGHTRGALRGRCASASERLGMAPFQQPVCNTRRTSERRSERRRSAIGKPESVPRRETLHRSARHLHHEASGTCQFVETSRVLLRATNFAQTRQLVLDAKTRSAPKLPLEQRPRTPSSAGA